MSLKTIKVEAVQVDGYKIEASSRQHKLLIDQPDSDGGTDAGPTALEYFLVSLAGCIINTGQIIARQRRYVIRKIEVRMEGVLDTDIVMGKTSTVRSGFMGIRAFTTVDADLSQDEKQKLLREIETRCPISDNIEGMSQIEIILA